MCRNHKTYIVSLFLRRHTKITEAICRCLHQEPIHKNPNNVLDTEGEEDIPRRELLRQRKSLFGHKAEGMSFEKEYTR